MKKLMMNIAAGNRFCKHAVFLLLSFNTICLSIAAQTFDPEEWHYESQRPSVATVFYKDSTVLFHGRQTLYLAGGGKTYSNGCWFNKVAVTPGTSYRFTGFFKTHAVSEVGRTVLATITWLDKSEKQTGYTEYPSLSKNTENEWQKIEQLYKAPANARFAKLELHYRWNDSGSVHFGDVTLQGTQAEKPRKVKIATVFYRPSGAQNNLENLEKFSKKIEAAGKQGADIVCLPEEMTLVGTGQDYVSASEPIPGPSTEYLGKLAARFNIYIVAGLLEKSGDAVYNTAVLIDRSGRLAGKYRKLSLPQEEITGGVTPGDNLPVFDTDFGRIGIMICWDVTFPETARGLATKGAEIIFLPIWGGNETLARARAIENQVYLVSSSYDMITAIFGLEGEVLKKATKENPVAIAEIDLNEQRLLPGLGDLKNRIPREMPPRKAIE